MKTRTTMWMLLFSAMLWSTYAYAQPSPSAMKKQQTVATTAVVLETEPNNTFETAQPLTPGDIVTGAFSEESDLSDYYRISIPDDGKLTIYYAPSSGLGCLLTLYSAAGIELKMGQGSWLMAGVNDTISVSNLGQGTYFVSVTRQNEYAGAGTYNLSVHFEGATLPSDREPNDTAEQALLIPLDQEITGRLGYRTEDSFDNADHYLVSIPDDGTLRIDYAEEVTAANGLVLYTEQGIELKRSQNSWLNPGGEDLILMGGLAKGVYRVMVFRENEYAGHGSYRLTASFQHPIIHTSEPEPNDSVEIALPLTLVVPFSGHLGFRSEDSFDDADFYSVMIPDDGTLTLTLDKGDVTNLAPTMILYTETKAELARGRQNWLNPGGVDNIVAPNLAAGTYFLKIFRENEYAGYGSYTITATYTMPAGANDQEPNNSFETANALSIHGAPQAGRLGFLNLGYPDNEDHYWFDLAYSGSIELQFVQEPSQAAFITIHNSSFDEIGHGVVNWMTAGASDTIRVETLDAGRYYVRVHRENEYAGYGCYTLVLKHQNGQQFETYTTIAGGGRWHDPATWLENEVPPYGANVVIMGPVNLDESTEVKNLTIVEGYLVSNSTQMDGPVDLMVVGNLINHRGIVSDNPEIGRGFTLNALGSIQNEGLIAVNELRLMNPELPQSIAGQGVIGYYPDAGEHLKTLNTFIMTSGQNILIQGQQTWTGVTLFSGVEAGPVVIIQPPYGLRIINRHTPELYSMMAGVKFTGEGVLEVDSSAVFLGSAFDPLHVEGDFRFFGRHTIYGDVYMNAGITPLQMHAIPTKVQTAAKKHAAKSILEENVLDVRGILTIDKPLGKAPGDPRLFHVDVHGSVTTRGGWMPDGTRLIGFEDQFFIVEGTAPFGGNIIAWANVANATTFQWYIGDHAIEEGTQEYIIGEPPFEGAQGILRCSTNVGWSRNIDLFIPDQRGLNAEFWVDMTSGPAPFTVQFHNETRDGDTWLWTFGDGETSNVRDPQHTYQNPGVYTVSLQVTKGDSTDTETKVDFIHVYQHNNGTGIVTGRVTDATTGNPLADVNVMVAGFNTMTDGNGFYRLENIPQAMLQAMFQAMPQMGPAPLNVQFTNLSTDGTHVVYANRPGYQPFYYRGLAVQQQMTTEFNFALSPQLNNAELRFVLGWGDRPVDLDLHVVTPSGAHVYFAERGDDTAAPWVILDHDVTTGKGPETATFAKFEPGTYNVFVHNFSGEESMAGKGARVQVYGRGGIIATIDIPETGEGLYWNIAEVDGATGAVTVLNTIDLNSPVASTAKLNLAAKRGFSTAETGLYTWDFGDGFTSIEENPQHTYTNPGRYGVRLTVDNGSRRTEMFMPDFIRVIDPNFELLAVNDTVTVTAGMSVRINMLMNDNIPPDMPVGVYFMGMENVKYGMAMPTFDMRSLMYISDEHSNGVDRIDYNINFNGMMSGASIFVRVVPGTGGNRGPTVYMPIEVTVLEDAVLEFPISKVVFDDQQGWRLLNPQVWTSNAELIGVSLDPETGMVRLASRPDWWGTAQVYLMVTDSQGMMAVDSMLVTVAPVNDPPVAGFKLDLQADVEGGHKVTLADLSHDMKDPEGSVVSWLWDFGDGETSTVQHPEHVYTSSGAYRITLTVTDNAGASSTTFTDIQVEVVAAETGKTYTLQLIGNHPNPFNPSTVIAFEIPEAGMVRLSLYNAVGQQVRTVTNARMNAGRYELPVNGSGLASGVYLYILEFGNQRMVKKMTLLK
jgi:PKD repeat protein